MTPLETLKKYWGYDSFRPMQEEIITSVLSGKDTLGLLPTGGGKSITFQVPALMNEGICLVISPLIALMKDQVANLQKRKIPASAVYSGMHYVEIDRIFDNAVFGKTKFLYLSPERLANEMALERIKRMNVNLIAVDEAHCISQWGYDFRPSYLQIAEIKELLPDIPVLALTATATPDVIDDIQDKLLFKEKNVFRQSFERKNLAYVVLHQEAKRKKLLEILRNVPGTGIVYARNRKLTKEVSYFLRKKGISADFYHAGLSTEIRSKKQDNWVNNKTRVIVSTNAFGMGIDKPDVRTVVHLDLPDSLEAYFQEAGRAGRDGKKSYAVLLYDEEDKINLEHNYLVSFPEFKMIRNVYRALGSYLQIATGTGIDKNYDFEIIDFAKKFGFPILSTFSCIKILEQTGWLVVSDAVFIPSKLKILVTKEHLYDYLLKNPKLEKILKSILRVLENAFMHYASFREKRLANFLRISIDELHKTLSQLAKEGIIDYLPQKDKPQITFLKERISADNLTFDTKLFNFRKKRYKKRIEEAIHYAESAECRNMLLLRYFGEKDVKKCGICDVCTGRTVRSFSNTEFLKTKKKILNLLVREKLTSDEIVMSFIPNRREKIKQILEYLLDESVLIIKDGKIMRNRE